MSVGTLTTTIILSKKFKKDFEDMIETYNYFLTHKEEIEALAKIDDNITRDITVRARKELIKSNKLLEEKLTDEQYTIQLIDSLSLKDLKEMSLRFKISQGLNSEPYFYVEEPVSEEPENQEIDYEQPISEEEEIDYEQLISEEEIDYEIDDKELEAMFADRDESVEEPKQNGRAKTLHQ